VGRRWWLPALPFLLLAAAGAGLALRLSALPAAARPQQGADDLVGLLFGNARQAVGAMLYQRADLYYHGGVAAAAAEHEHGAALTADARADVGAAGHDHDHDHDHDHCHDHCHGHGHESGHGPVAGGRWGWNPWQGIQAWLRPAAHIHLAGKRLEKEVLPWLWAAAKVDPRNPDPYLVGAYWLARRLQRPEEGLQLIEEGIRNLPAEPELEFVRAELLLRASRPAVARQGFERALAKWRPLPASADAAARADHGQLRSRILLYLGRLAADAGDLAAARAAYRQILAHDPGHAGARQHLRELDAVPPFPASP